MISIDSVEGNSCLFEVAYELLELACNKLKHTIPNGKGHSIQHDRKLYLTAHMEATLRVRAGLIAGSVVHVFLTEKVANVF